MKSCSLQRTSNLVVKACVSFSNVGFDKEQEGNLEDEMTIMSRELSRKSCVHFYVESVFECVAGI